MKKVLSHFKYSIILSSVILIFAGFLPIEQIIPRPPQHPLLTTYDLESDSTDTSPDPSNITDPPVDTPDPTPPSDTFSYPSNLIIKAVNPGYKIDGIGDVGELIELQNLTDAPLSLAGFSLRYTNGSGNSTMLISFADGSLMTGEYLLLRYTKSPDSNLSDTIYTTGLALTAGPLELLYDDAVVDSVCWTGKSGCEKAFKTAKPTTLVRDVTSNTFSHESTYDPHFDPAAPSLVLPAQPDAESPAPDSESSDLAPDTFGECSGVEFTEVYSYYATDKSEQFIELYNSSDHDVDLSNCQLRYKKKIYPLEGTISPDQYFAYYPNGVFTLTKNPTTSNSIELIDRQDKLVDELVYQHGQKKSTSYAKFFEPDGSELWSQTYAPTPGTANVYQEFRSCPAGKVINPSTGNCINSTSVQKTVTECPAGKYRNPLTGRCKSIETATTQKPCAEGYERNPTTNRCRKVKSDNDGTDFALVPTTRTEQTTFIAFGVVALIVSLGILYIILQFRRELARLFRKFRQRLHNFFNNLFSRKIGRDRHKQS